MIIGAYHFDTNNMGYLLRKLLSYFPSNLPVGMSDYQIFIDEIIELSGEFADRDSMAFAISSMVIHLGPQRSSVSKNYFVRSLRKVAANQVASAAFQDIKQRQEEKLKAAQAAQTPAQPTADTPQAPAANDTNKEV